MTMLTVHELPEEVHSALRARAARHGRSTEAEIRIILQDTVQADLPGPQDEPATGLHLVNALAAISRRHGVTDADIDALQRQIAKNKQHHAPMQLR